MEGEENSKFSENPSSDEPLTHIKAYVGHSKQIVFTRSKNRATFLCIFFTHQNAFLLKDICSSTTK